MQQTAKTKAMSTTASLWRTERPRFPAYAPDGNGRDYYIKYTNGGYWENQFQVKKKPDYERPRYSNFHTLFHQAAPFKYWGNGAGRETYVLQTNGLFHEQKPLCAYKLIDFLRNNDVLRCHSRGNKKKMYMSLSEKKYNEELRHIEKKLIKRLYTEPMNLKRSKSKPGGFTKFAKISDLNLEENNLNINGNEPGLYQDGGQHLSTGNLNINMNGNNLPMNMKTNCQGRNTNLTTDINMNNMNNEQGFMRNTFTCFPKKMNLKKAKNNNFNQQFQGRNNNNNFDFNNEYSYENEYQHVNNTFSNPSFNEVSKNNENMNQCYPVNTYGNHQYYQSDFAKDRILEKAAADANSVKANNININGNILFNNNNNGNIHNTQSLKVLNNERKSKTIDKKNQKFYKTGNFFYKNKNNQLSGPLNIDTGFTEETMPQFKKMKKDKDVFNACCTENYINPGVNMRFIDPRGKYPRTMNAAFKFKPKPKMMNHTTKNFYKVTQ